MAETLSRREFLTGTVAAAFGAALAKLPRLELEEPEFVDFEIDEERFGEAIKIGAPYLKDGRAWADVKLDMVKAWEAITIYASDGSVWHSGNGGETFEQVYMGSTTSYLPCPTTTTTPVDDE